VIVGRTKIGRYDIERHVASGGMAEVYQARDPVTGGLVALKIPHDGEEIWEAERTGAALQIELSNRDVRVPRVYEIGAGDERFVAMEYVEGEDLSRRLQNGALEWREATRIAIELCGVLATARSCGAANGEPGGVVHGDIKPRNIRIQEGGRIKVLDFGIAKALRVTRAETRNLYGSVPYSSPERLDRGHVDYHSDLWSVAVVLYEMLEGRRPFRSASEAELERAIRSGLPPAPIERDIPLEFEAVLEKALARDLASRYASAGDLEMDLRAVLLGHETCAAREREARRAGDGWGADAPLETVAGLGGLAAPDGAIADATDPDATRRSSEVTPGADPDATRRGAALDRGAAEALVVNGAGAANLAPATDPDATRRTAPDPRTSSDADATRRSAPATGAPADPDATRRGERAASMGAHGDAAATVAAGARTSYAAAGESTAVGGASAAPPATSAVPATRARPRLRIRWKALAAFAIVIFAAREVQGLGAARDLRSSLASRPRGEAAAVWSEYRRVARGHLLVHVSGLGGAVREWMVSHADDLISRYRSDTPTIYETGWRSAEALLKRAATLDPGNRRIQARLEYCRAHLLRIGARDSKDRGESMSRYDEAVSRFERAARLWSGWPDPWIGLAQIDAYGKKDPERTAEALERAREAGYPFGERETALLGDAYRLRAERRWAGSTDAFDVDQQYRHLERIRDDCAHALEQYELVPSYAGVSRHLRTLRQRLAEIDARMRALSGESESSSEPSAPDTSQ
jgi:eukaryotic-like serine/threonine-protein kinase